MRPNAIQCVVCTRFHPVYVSDKSLKTHTIHAVMDILQYSGGYTDVYYIVAYNHVIQIYTYVNL